MNDDRDRTRDDAVYEAIRSHLETFWRKRRQEEFVWTLGPIGRSLPRFRVRRVAPERGRDPWAYVTVGAWEATRDDGNGTEFVLLSPEENPLHVELLAMVANLHADPRYRLRLGSTINIGRPWMDGSLEDHLLVALPYPFGPALERLDLPHRPIRFLWLVPITSSEAQLVRERGPEALERLLDRTKADVVDPRRPSMV